MIVAIGGICSVNYLHDVVDNSNVYTDVITIQDKVYGDNPNSDYYIVLDTKNRTYSIVDHGDGYGKKMFDGLELNQSYEVVVKQPDITDINKFLHIIQVHNDTS